MLGIRRILLCFLILLLPLHSVAGKHDLFKYFGMVSLLSKARAPVSLPSKRLMHSVFQSTVQAAPYFSPVSKASFYTCSPAYRLPSKREVEPLVTTVQQTTQQTAQQATKTSKYQELSSFMSVASLYRDIEFVRDKRHDMQVFWDRMGMTTFAQGQLEEEIRCLLLKNADRKPDAEPGNFRNMYEGYISISYLPYISIGRWHKGLGLPFSCYPYILEMIGDTGCDSPICPEASWVVASLLSMTSSASTLQKLVLPQMAVANCIGVLADDPAKSTVRVVAVQEANREVAAYRLCGSTLITTQREPSDIKPNQHFIHLVEADLPDSDGEGGKGLFLVYENKVVDDSGNELLPANNRVVWQSTGYQSNEGHGIQYKVSFDHSVGYLVGRTRELPAYRILVQLGAAMSYLRSLSGMLSLCHHMALYGHLRIGHTRPMFMEWLGLCPPVIKTETLQLLQAEAMVRRDRIYQAMKYLDIIASYTEDKREQEKAWDNLAGFCPLLGNGQAYDKGLPMEDFSANLIRKLEGAESALDDYDAASLQYMVNLVKSSLVSNKVSTPLLSVIGDSISEHDEKSRLFRLIESDGDLPTQVAKVKSALTSSDERVQEAARALLNLYDRIDRMERVHGIIRAAEEAKKEDDEGVTVRNAIVPKMEAFLNYIKL